jgi:hypothetical protein
MSHSTLGTTTTTIIIKVSKNKTNTCHPYGIRTVVFTLRIIDISAG